MWERVKVPGNSVIREDLIAVWQVNALEVIIYNVKVFQINY